jgi:ribosomal protein S18 acetylase RimI-like enzyme
MKKQKRTSGLFCSAQPTQHRHREIPGMTKRVLLLLLLLLASPAEAFVGPAQRPALHAFAGRTTPMSLSASSASASTPWLVPLQPASLARVLNKQRLRRASRDDVIIRGATTRDALSLARLCTDCFFGAHEIRDGPVIFCQRALIYARVLNQVMRRLAIEEGRECKLLVAEDKDSGAVTACVDVAIHLFDRDLSRFELMIDQMPVGREARRRYGWRPYVASLAVDSSERRRGLGRLLMREAERTARGWGYREIMLEVARENVDAISFYSKLGYQVVGEDERGTGATMVRVVNTPLGKSWTIENVGKLLMSKGVGLLL